MPCDASQLQHLQGIPPATDSLPTHQCRCPNPLGRPAWNKQIEVIRRALRQNFMPRAGRLATGKQGSVIRRSLVTLFGAIIPCNAIQIPGKKEFDVNIGGKKKTLQTSRENAVSG